MVSLLHQAMWMVITVELQDWLFLPVYCPPSPLLAVTNIHCVEGECPPRHSICSTVSNVEKNYEIQAV
ncbi:hypothetical protein MUP77_22495 [Candidatus Bathyarchaeota archaeon]|nr:hypothetical protein [Candidatus Bathyarchaeota archaeon]